MAHDLIGHGEDIMAVFGFEKNACYQKLFSRNKDLKTNKSWVKFISTDMIDSKKFHRELERKYPKLRLVNPIYHRLLFHWPYNAEPWSRDLERHIRDYCRKNNRDAESIIAAIKRDVKEEQRRRNRKINEETENVFGFAHGGVDAKYAQFFASMAYNVHLLGDRQSGNKVFDGVADTRTLIGQIILSLRMLDRSTSRPIERELTIIDKKYGNQQKKADAVMRYLKQVIPSFIKQAKNGSIYRRLESHGFKIK